MNTRTFLLTLASSGFLVAASRTGRAAEGAGSRLVADLIWGTNGEKPPGRELQPIAADLDKRLRRIFKWRNYYRIERKEFAVAPAKPARVEMSKECRIEVAALPADEFEIELYGKGVLVVRKKQRIVPGETVVLGGDDKNDDAWFVVLALARSPGDGAK